MIVKIEEKEKKQQKVNQYLIAKYGQKQKGLLSVVTYEWKGSGRLIQIWK